MYRQSGYFVETTEGSKWIFVLSTSRALYVGQKRKGQFQHSSFLSGGATTAAGRLVAHNGVLEVHRFIHASILSSGIMQFHFFRVSKYVFFHARLSQAIWPYSGHYHPTEENFKEFISFLEEHRVNLTDVKVISPPP